MDVPDLKASRTTIAVREPSPPNVAAPTYFSAQLAPDQRIYISATNGIQYLHVIDNPDKAGADCGFREKGLKLPTYNQSSMPNFPNYRLGPLDGSPCDTLGLDNRPVAWYRYTQDTLNPLSVAFHDLSYYEPTKWVWDFGDGKGSSERHPTHTYTTKGVYEVCLTASNANSSSTHCKKILLGVSKAGEPEAESGLQVGPNPFDGRIVVALSASISGTYYRLFDQLGRMVLSSRIQQGINEIDASALSTGMYFWEVVAGNEPIGNGKLVKVR
jgi:PKD repeat protein